jgi:hypothetical protein
MDHSDRGRLRPAICPWPGSLDWLPSGLRCLTGSKGTVCTVLTGGENKEHDHGTGERENAKQGVSEPPWPRPVRVDADLVRNIKNDRPDHATAVPLVPAGAVCPRHFQFIAHKGACGKAPVMPQTGSDVPGRGARKRLGEAGDCDG